MNKSLTLRTTKTYPDLTARLDSNSFGDQIIEIIHETLSGAKIMVFREVNPEGNHRTHAEIKKIGLAKMNEFISRA